MIDANADRRPLARVEIILSFPRASCRRFAARIPNHDSRRYLLLVQTSTVPQVAARSKNCAGIPANEL